MLFRRLRKFRESLVLSSAPTVTKPTEESQSLAEKYDAQVQWMREKGITGTLDGTPDPSQKPERSVPASLMQPENPEE